MPSAPSVPVVRADRAEGFSPLAIGPAAPRAPIVTLWPFAIQEAAPGDRHVTSPLFKGPGIIDSLFLLWTDDNTPPRPTITVHYGLSLPASGQSSGGTISRFGTPIFTVSAITTEAPGEYQGDVQQIPKFTFAAGSQNQIFPFRFPVPIDQFQVLLRMGTQAGASQTIAGYFRILEAVPPELLPNFL